MQTTEPKIIVARHAGFCFGVKRAIDMLDSLVDKGGRIYSLGQFIHNTAVTDSFKVRGVSVIKEDFDSLEAGSTVFIRAHGAPPSVICSLRECGCIIHDGTCPFVKKIHDIIDRLDPDTEVLIFGDPAHPEVKGIVGHAKGTVHVFTGYDEAAIFFAEEYRGQKLAAAAQTTFNVAEWTRCRILLAQNGVADTDIYDTICNTTEERQKEALELSTQCDMTIVIGDRSSSNTKKLFEIAKRHCRAAIYTENARGLKALIPSGITRLDKIAITAGASTPSSIIEEVTNTMAEIIQEQSFEELLANSFKTLHTGEKVTGIISMVSPAEIHVDLGTKHTGILPYDEVTSESGVDLTAEYHVGDPIEVVCLKFSDADGTVQLSKKRLDADKNWVNIVSAEQDGVILNGTVREVTKGGVIVYVSGTKIFVPASHTGIAKDGDMHTLLGKSVPVKVIETNDQRKRAVGSIRNAARIERKRAIDEFYANLEVGQKFTGTVRAVTDYGVFVNIGPVEGMAHITELSWGRLRSPHDLFKVGDTIDVYVKKIDAERHRISLGYKTEENDPHRIFAEKYHVGDVVEAQIVSIMPFGAFAEIIPGIDGLIHNTQIALKPVSNPASVLNIGDKVTVKITDIDSERNRVSLSIKALLEGGEDETNTPAEQPAETETNE